MSDDVIEVIQDTSVVEVYTGLPGLSAYALAVANGFVGTIGEWLLSLQGGMEDLSDIVRVALASDTAGDFRDAIGLGSAATASAASLLARQNHSGTQALDTVAGLVVALAALAPRSNPIFTGTVAVPTPAAGTNSPAAASTAFVQAALSALVGNATPATLDTLKELADALGDDPNFAATVTAQIAGKLAKASNLSDLASAATSRTNLGLGDAATKSVGTATGTVADAGAVATSLAGKVDLTSAQTVSGAKNFAAATFGSLAGTSYSVDFGPRNGTAGQWVTALDLHTGAANDFDVRLVASGGTTADGGGRLDVTAGGGLFINGSPVGGGGGGVAGVSTFNGRGGAVNLLGGDVTSALGFSPVQTGGGAGMDPGHVLKLGWTGARVRVDVDGAYTENLACVSDLAGKMPVQPIALASGTDLNTVQTPGFYVVQSAINGVPTAVSGTLVYLLVEGGTSWTKQTATTWGNAGEFGNETFIRIQAAGTWISWRRIVHDDTPVKPTGSGTTAITIANAVRDLAICKRGYVTIEDAAGAAWPTVGTSDGVTPGSGPDEAQWIRDAVSLAVSLGVHRVHITSGVHRLASQVTVRGDVELVGNVDPKAYYFTGSNNMLTVPANERKGTWVYVDHAGIGLQLGDGNVYHGGGFKGFGICRNQPTPNPASQGASWTPAANDWDVVATQTRGYCDLFHLNATRGIKWITGGFGQPTISFVGQAFQRAVWVEDQYDCTIIPLLYQWPFWSLHTGVKKYTLLNLTAVTALGADGVHGGFWFSIFHNDMYEIGASGAHDYNLGHHVDFMYSDFTGGNAVSIKADTSNNTLSINVLGHTHCFGDLGDGTDYDPTSRNGRVIIAAGSLANGQFTAVHVGAMECGGMPGGAVRTQSGRTRVSIGNLSKVLPGQWNRNGFGESLLHAGVAGDEILLGVPLPSYIRGNPTISLYGGSGLVHAPPVNKVN